VTDPKPDRTFSWSRDRYPKRQAIRSISRSRSVTTGGPGNCSQLTIGLRQCWLVVRLLSPLSLTFGADPILDDLRECNDNWCRYFEQHWSGFVIFPGVTEQDIEDENATMVAVRGTRYLQFFDKPGTRFEFASNGARWELQEALLRAGWRTWDRD
jgi:hypothetical protein